MKMSGGVRPVGVDPIEGFHLSLNASWKVGSENGNSGKGHVRERSGVRTSARKERKKDEKTENSRAYIAATLLVVGLTVPFGRPRRI